MNSAELRWPDPALSPNGRVHYMTRHRAVSRYRQAAHYAGRGGKCLAVPVCAILPLVATRRRRDLDNVLASLKSAIDGLTDSGWWKDDHDIRGYHMVPDIYSKLWQDNRIVVLACEAADAAHMQLAIIAFQLALTEIDPNPHAALRTLRESGPPHG